MIKSTKRSTRGAKTLLVSCLVLGCLSTTNAQESQLSQADRWSFGIKGGLNFMNYDNDVLYAGFNLGATVDYDLGNQLFLRSGLEFIGKEKYTDANRYYSTSIKEDGSIDYKSSGISAERSNIFLQMPLTVGYRLPISKRVNLTLNAGVYAAIGLHSNGNYQKWNYESTLDKDGEFINWKNDSDIKYLDDAGNFDFGLLGGIGIEYRRFSYNISYEYGLINQSSKTYKDWGGDALKYNGLSVTATYRF